MKTITILGPIANSGGRAIEVNQIAKSLEKQYSVQIISVEPFDERKSIVIKGLQNSKAISINKLLYKGSISFKILGLLASIKNKNLSNPYNFINGKYSKKFLRYNQKREIIISQIISKSDLVILPIQLGSNFFKAAIEQCYEAKIPCIVRITGKIPVLDTNAIAFLKKVNLFIHHSERNAELLFQILKVPFQIIDQYAPEEKELLSLPLDKIKPLRFGFLGRFSSEKGAYEIASFFADSEEELVMGGDGPDKAKILNIIDNKPNCSYLGYIPSGEKSLFMRELDVLIIASYEEAGPLTGIEAMAAGKIILSTEVGAMPERMKGLKYNPWFQINKNKTLIERINYLHNLPEESLNKLATQIRKRYLANFKELKIASSYLNIIRQYI